MIKRMAAAVLATVVVMLGLAGTASAQVAPSLDQCPLLLEGQSSECVRMLQQALNRSGAAYGLTEDGQFGAATRIALLDFQGRNRLPADGNAGPITLRELVSQTSSVATPPAGPKVVVTDTEVCEAAGGMVPDGKGGCKERASGAAVAMGRPIGECVSEQVKKGLQSFVSKKRGIGGKAIAAGKGGIKRFKALYEVPKCALWDTPK